MQAAKTQHPLDVSDLSPRIGSAILADKVTLLRGNHGAAIRALLERRGVVLVRAVNLTDEEQLAFTATLGPVVKEQQVLKISMDPGITPNAEYVKGAFYWHIDGTTLDVPMFAAVMSARKLSPTGGQTEFCNTYAAYDDLPASDKSTLEKLRVVHLFEAAQRYVNPEPSHETLKTWQRFPAKTLPLVWTHRSGRKSLVLGSTASHVEGMDLREGWALLARLRDWSTQPQFVYRHEWTVGDLVIWDNTGTMHRALPYPMDSGRQMHRTQISGDEPIA